MHAFKPTGKITLALIIGLSPLNLLAQSNGLSPLQGVQGTLGIQAGNYNFQSYDKGRLQELVINQAKEAQEADRQYILSVAAQVEVIANGLVKDINGEGGIQKINDDAYAAGQRVDLRELLKSFRAYNVSMNNLRTKLASIKALPSAMKKEETMSLEGSGIVQLRTKGIVDLTAIISFYNEQMKKIDDQVNSIVINTVLPNKTPLIGKSLKQVLEEVSKNPPYTQKEIQEKIAEEARLRFVGTERLKKMEQHYLKAFKLVMQYVENFGKDQKYRLNTTPEERKAILEELALAMWSRSLLRATSGVSQGAIGINFSTQTFNAEYVFASNQISFMANPIMKQEEINSQRRKLLIALSVMDKRDDSILAAETPFFNRILSGLTFIKGEAQLAQVNVEILKLLYADMAEEAVLATQGFSGMRRHYQTRWYTGQSEAQVSEIRARAKEWRSQDNLNPDNIRGTFLIADNALKSYLVQLDEAEKLKAEIEIFSNNSDVMKKYRKQADDL